MCDGFVWLEFLALMCLGFFCLIASGLLLFNVTTFLLFVSDYKNLFSPKAPQKPLLQLVKKDMDSDL